MIELTLTRRAVAWHVLVLGLAVAGTAAAQTAGRTIWWEGEDYAETSLPRPEAPYPGDITPPERTILSGGKWLGTVGEARADGKPHTITYRVRSRAAGTYHFWVRKFWHHGPFRWRFGDSAWRECQRGRALSDATFMRKHFGAYWVFLGMVALSPGEHTLTLEMIDSKGGAIDCFVLSARPFLPRGKLKPGERSGKAFPGWFAWEPDADPLRDDCPIDLRHLNERTAGVNGFVRRDGSRFRRGDGEVLRFWMLQDGGLGALDQPFRDQAARRVAKYGVNLARIQCLGLFKAWADEDDGRFAAELERLHSVVASYKKAGVYTYLGHLFWHTHVTVSKAHGFPNYEKPGNPLVSLNVDPAFRKRYLEYLDRVLNAVNPHTGLPLGKDPAVAFVEIQNESGVLFWTFKPEAWPQPVRVMMEKAFGEWAGKRHGSLAKARQTWGDKKAPKHADHPAEGRLGLYMAGFFSGQDWAVAARNPKRAGDQLRFLVELQSRTYERLIKAMREDLGVKALITCSNWHTADDRVLEALERYSNLPGDALCRNTYYGVAFKPKPERFYAIDIGNTFVGRSTLQAPSFPKPLTCAHVHSHPYMVTENCWTRPNRYRAEWPFLVAAYASLTGVDGWTFFAGKPTTWVTDMGVWDVQTPVVMGQFPAAALAYRAGYIKEAQPAVTEHLAFSDLYALKGTALYPGAGTDAMWQERLGRVNEASRGGDRVDSLAFFVGRVERWLGDRPGRIETVSLSDFIDRKAKRVRSLTGQIEWDFGNGVVVVDAPRVQGACGFLRGGGVRELSCLRIRCNNEYASVMVIALDGKPLAESGRILIQAATEDLPFGFKTEAKGNGHSRITAKGGYPLNVVKIDASVTIANSRASRATVLDFNGYSGDRKASCRRTPKGLEVTLPADSLYTIVE